MKINPISEMTIPAYKEIKPVDNKELEKAALKVETQAPAIKEPYKPEPAEKKADVDDGRETIAISNDGDVAKASKAALENISEGLVFKKTPEPEKAAETNDTAKSVTDAAKDGSLIAYSKDELERLYLQGDINSNQLDKELERREEIRGEKKDAADAIKQDEQDEKDTNNEIAKAMEDNRENGVRQVTEQNEEVIKSQKEAAEKQADAVQEKRQDERADAAEKESAVSAADNENRKQIITEEMDRDDRFVQEMTVLSGAERDAEIKSEAFETAVENDRLKLMEQVFNVDPAVASNV